MTRFVLLAALLASGPLTHAQQVPVSTSSDVARTQFVLGVTALGHIDNARAVEHLDAALAADPAFAHAHLYRAMASADGRDEHLRRAADGRASDAERQLVEAYQARLQGDRARQLALLTDLTTRFPDDPALWLRVANAQASQGNAAAAAASARNGITADRSYAPLYNTLGYAALALGHMKEADAAFRGYIRLSPGEPNAHDSYSEFLLAAGRLELAQTQYEMAIALNPEFDPERRGLARIGIAESGSRFEQAVADRDPDAIAALFADGAVLLPPDSPPVQGQDAIRDYMAEFVSSGGDSMDIQSVEVVRFDNVAIERANLTFRANGRVVDHGKALSVWGLVGEEWLPVRYMWSMNRSLSEGTH